MSWSSVTESDPIASSGTPLCLHLAHGHLAIPCPKGTRHVNFGVFQEQMDHWYLLFCRSSWPFPGIASLEQLKKLWGKGACLFISCTRKRGGTSSSPTEGPMWAVPKPHRIGQSLTLEDISSCLEHLPFSTQFLYLLPRPPLCCSRHTWPYLFPWVPAWAPLLFLLGWLLIPPNQCLWLYLCALLHLWAGPLPQPSLPDCIEGLRWERRVCRMWKYPLSLGAWLGCQLSSWLWWLLTSEYMNRSHR